MDNGLLDYDFDIDIYIYIFFSMVIMIYFFILCVHCTLGISTDSFI